MEQYAQMKESGVAWIRDIPSSWGVRVLFQLADQVKNKNRDLAEKNLLSLSYGKIKRKDIDSPEGLLPESFDGYNIIEANDIVLRLTDLQNDHTSLRVGQAKERGIITSAYTTLRPSASVNPQYLYYVIHAYDLIKGFYGMGSGVRQGLNYDEVKTIKVPFPSMNEQERIVAYLDDQVSQIDSIIDDAKGSIGEYKRWKDSTIFEALTKGVNPSISMRNSGVDWIDKIPITSRVVRLRYLVQDYKAGPFGSALITDKLLREGTILVYTPEHVANQNTESNKNLFLPEVRSEEMTQFFVHPGDIVFPIVGSLGRAMMISEEMPNGIINQRLAKFSLRKGSVDPGYFMWAFGKSSFFAPYIDVNRRGSFILNLTKSIVYDMPFVLPNDISEQTKVSNYLDQRCGEIDAMINEKEEAIKELEIYKRSLIYESVTGKRKVV